MPSVLVIHAERYRIPGIATGFLLHKSYWHAGRDFGNRPSLTRSSANKNARVGQRGDRPRTDVLQWGEYFRAGRGNQGERSGKGDHRGEYRAVSMVTSPGLQVAAPVTNGVAASGQASASRVTGKDSLEILTKFLAVLAICTYIVGVLTVNSYLFSFGIADFSPLRPRFIYTGVLVLGAVAMSFVFPLYGLTIVLERHPRLRAADPLLESKWLVLPSHFRVRPASRGALRQGHRWPSLLSWAFRVVHVFLDAVSVPFLLLTPWLVHIGYALASEAGATAGDADQSILALWSALKYGTAMFILAFLAPMMALATAHFAAQSGQEVERIKRLLALPYIAVGVSFALFFLLVYASIFSTRVYPQIPEQFGGGMPKHVRMLLASDAVDGAQQLGVPMSGTTPLLSEPVTVVFEGSESFVLRLTDGTIVQLDRKAVKGIRIRVSSS